MSLIITDHYKSGVMKLKMVPPRISIITVVYNAKEDLESTIVNSVLNQSYQNIEYIVIDGGSTDGTKDIISKYRSYIHAFKSEKDSGIYDAMNKGMEMASGDYVTFLNAGDYYFNNEVLVNLFKDIDKEIIDLVYGDIYVIDKQRNETKYQKALKFNLDNLLQYGTGVVCHQAVFVKREISPKYNTNLTYKAELNWYFDIVEKYPELKYIHKNLPVVNYYLWGKGYKNFWKNQLEWFKLILNRFGIKTFIKYHYHFKIFQRILYRYPMCRMSVDKLKKMIALIFLK